MSRVTLLALQVLVAIVCIVLWQLLSTVPIFGLVVLTMVGHFAVGRLEARPAVAMPAPPVAGSSSPGGGPRYRWALRSDLAPPAGRPRL